MEQATRSLIVLLLLAAVAGGATPRSEKGGEGEEGRVVLENALVRATVDPVGGALVSFVVKDGDQDREILAGPSFRDSNIAVGRRRVQDLAGLRFEVAEGSKRADAVTELSAALPKGVPLDANNMVGRAWDAIVWHPKESLKTEPFETIRLTKRFRLRRGEAVLDVEYELANSGKEPVVICLATDVLPAGKKLCLPTREGPVVADLPMDWRNRAKYLRFRGYRTWLYDTPGAWAANIGRDGKGVVMAFDPRHCSFLQVDVRKPLVRVARTRVTIPPGKTFTTRAWVMPVSGLAKVQDARSQIAASFAVTPEAADGVPTIRRRSYTAEMLKGVTLDPALPTGVAEVDPTLTEALAKLDAPTAGRYEGPSIRVRMNLYSVRDRRVEVATRIDAGPVGVGKKLTLRAGRTTPVDVVLRPKTSGTYVVHAELREDGDVVARFEHPVIAGRPKRFYWATLPAREGEVNEDYYYEHCGRQRNPIRWDWEPTTAVESQHLKFARPLSGGPLQTLIVTPYGRARDVVELAQRIEIDYDVLIMSVWDFSMEAGAHAPVSEVDRLKQLLNGKHDVIILGAVMGQRFPASVVEEICRQVEEEGVGLIVSMSAHLAGTLDEWNKKAKRDRKRFGDSRARIADVGRGRVAFFDGEIDVKHLCINWISQSRKPTEYDYSAFLRVMLWASGRKPAVTLDLSGPTTHVERAGLSREKLNVSLTNRNAAAFRGVMRLVARKDLEADYPHYGMMWPTRRPYPSWQDWGGSEREVAVAAGATEVLSLKLLPLPSGHFSIDATIVDEKGATVAWRRLPVAIRSRARIAEVTVEDALKRATHVKFGKDMQKERRLHWSKMRERFFTADQGGYIDVTCLVEGRARSVSARCHDPWGRVVFEGEARLADGRAAFHIPVDGAYHRILELELRISDDAGCIQEQRLLGFIQPRPERQPAFGWVTYSPDSDLRPDVTGYDSRYRGGVGVTDIVKHAWCNMNMTGLFGARALAMDVIMPGPTAPEAPAAPTMEGGETAGADVLADLNRGKPDLRKGYIRVPCLLDPKWRAGVMKFREEYFRTRSFICRPFNAIMGDEFFYTKELVAKRVPCGFRRRFILSRDGNICRCRHCLKEFREYVRGAYGGDLAAVNRKWGAKYTSWEEVEPPLLSRNRVKVEKDWTFVDVSTSDDSHEESCPPEEKWPHVIDHRRFIDYQVAGFLADIRAAARRGAPTSRFGWGDLMGNTSMWNGMDAYLISPHMDFNGLDHEINIWRSLGNPDNASFAGYTKQYSNIRQTYTSWHMLFVGNTGIGNYNSEEWPKYRRDHTYQPSSLVTFDVMREIRDNGFDRLLVGHRYNDPVAILYDPTSIYLSEIQEWQEDQAKFFAHMRIAARSHNDTCKKVEQSYARLLTEHGLQYYTIGYGHLEEGHFGQFGKPRVLLLPYTQCISLRQAATLEKFVRDGGVLIGDVHTGLRDAHGERRPKGVLDHVFGIRRTAAGGMRVRRDAAGKSIPVNFGRESGGPYALGFEAVGPGDVAATSAKAYASFMLNGKKQPAFLVNSFGKGRAVYLNFLPAGYHEVIGDMVEGDEGVGKDLMGSAVGVKTAKGTARDNFRAMFNIILKIAEMKDPVRSDGTPGIYRFGDGDIEYVGVDAGYKYPERWRRPYTLRVLGKRHIYDAREGKYLGLGDTIQARFDEDALKMSLLYALVPYKVEALRVTLDKRTVRRGGTVAFSMSLEPAAARKQRHVVSVRVIDPSGKDLRWYGGPVETRDGVAKGRVDLALNDAAGTWTIRLRDAATGTAAETTFEVR